MAAQRGVAVDTRVQDSDFDDCDALLEGRMGDGWQLFFQTANVQASAALRRAAPRDIAPRAHACARAQPAALTSRVRGHATSARMPSSSRRSGGA